MQLHFIKASPCRNTTVFITDPAVRAQYGLIAGQVMSPEYLAAEQAGFLTDPQHPEALLRLEMAGGEFCGNATLALAALAVRQGRTDGKSFYVECSGAAEPLACTVLKLPRNRWRARAEMPAGDDVHPLTLQVGGQSYAGGLVILPGICHFVLPGSLPCSQYEPLMAQLSAAVRAEAYGIIPYEETSAAHYRIVPYVYVPAAGSRVFEQACGSGSLSLGLWLRHKTGLQYSEVAQPGGILTVETGKQNYITAEVYFPCEGILEAEES